MTLERFDLELADATLEYLANDPAVSARGGVTQNYPTSGVVLNGYVQVDGSQDYQPSGDNLALTGYAVYLIDDPSTLNPPTGIVQNDAFRWDGNLLIVLESPNHLSGDNLWRVKCRVVQ